VRVQIQDLREPTRAGSQVRLEGLVLAPACGGELPRSVVEHFGSKWTSTLPIVVALQVRGFRSRFPWSAG